MWPDGIAQRAKVSRGQTVSTLTTDMIALSVIAFRWFGAGVMTISTSGWRETKVAWINLAGFVAMLFNMFTINIVVSSLHSYAGLS